MFCFVRIFVILADLVIVFEEGLYDCLLCGTLSETDVEFGRMTHTERRQVEITGLQHQLTLHK